jgi:hypothetical protein
MRKELCFVAGRIEAQASKVVRTLAMGHEMLLVRPERLFALRAHPFGAALRAFNFACGEVVELGLFHVGSSN